MAMVTFSADGVTRDGYLALPAGGSGDGILVLHAWWGLTDFFKTICDRLAASGFVAFAPDLHHGKTANTIDEASHILETRDFLATQATAEAALHFLQAHLAVQGDKLGALGFSMGAAFALLLDSLHPEAFDRIVLFYGTVEPDSISVSKAQFQGHFGEGDEWEPLDGVKAMAGTNIEIHTYPHVGHWFVEEDQPESFNPEAARLAWDRTVHFFQRE